MCILTLLLTPALAAPPAECGLASTELPDFTLVDMNTHSPTYKQVVSSDDHPDEVKVIYWAYAP